MAIILEDGSWRRQRLLSQSAFNLESLQFLPSFLPSESVGGQPDGLQFSFFVSGSVIEGPIYLEEEREGRRLLHEQNIWRSVSFTLSCRPRRPAGECETMAARPEV